MSQERGVSFRGKGGEQVKLKSTLRQVGISDRFLRRMVSWCCRQLELPAKRIKEAIFRRRTDGFTSGHAWPWRYRFTISAGVHGMGDAYGVDNLVSVTAHELAHIEQSYRARRTGHHGPRAYRRPMIDGGSEYDTRRFERRTLEAFKAERETLLAKWNAGAEIPAARPRAERLAARVEQRAEKAEKMLAAWQRKAKLAAGKIRKYKQRVAYYQRRSAVAASPAKGG